MWKRVITLAEIVVLPLIIVFVTLFSDRKYYMLSSAALMGILILCWRFYDSGRPQAREIVVIAVMCALTVICRAVFAMIPHVMPAAAIIIIAGMALGEQPGFLVGSMSIFVSNFFAGQGPWTIWQMFAYGLLGYLAGFLYRKKIIKNSIFSAGVFAVLAMVLIVGPILDTCTLCTISTVYTAKSAAAIYLTGLPINVIHGVGAAVGISLFLHLLMEKLDRIKLKYGMVDNEI